jgi:uncharacterized membrane protein YraQ (UPF0718 family)
LALIIAAGFIFVLVWQPARALNALDAGMRSLLSVTVIIISVFTLIGLFTVWVREEHIEKYFGAASGARGFFLGALLGTVFHGPILSFFPVLRSMVDKRARTAIVVTAVSAFSIKLPMIPLEWSYFGPRFTILHNLLLLATAPIIGIIMERLLRGD